MSFTEPISMGCNLAICLGTLENGNANCTNSTMVYIIYALEMLETGIGPI